MFDSSKCSTSCSASFTLLAVKERIFGSYLSNMPDCSMTGYALYKGLLIFDKAIVRYYTVDPIHPYCRQEAL